MALRTHIDDDGVTPVPLPPALAASALFHELRHALQAPGGISTRIPYTQTYGLFITRYVECDAFACQIAFVMDSRNDGMITETFDYITRNMDDDLTQRLKTIAGRWHESTGADHRDQVLADLFWFMNDSGYLRTYDDQNQQRLRAFIEGRQMAVEIPPADAEVGPVPVRQAYKQLHDLCFDYFIKLQALPSLTGNRGGSYLGDAHEEIVERLLTEAVTAQYRNVSIDHPPVPRTAKMPVPKSGRA